MTSGLKGPERRPGGVLGASWRSGDALKMGKKITSTFVVCWIGSTQWSECDGARLARSVDRGAVLLILYTSRQFRYVSGHFLIREFRNHNYG